MPEKSGPRIVTCMRKGRVVGGVVFSDASPSAGTEILMPSVDAKSREVTWTYRQGKYGVNFVEADEDGQGLRDIMTDAMQDIADSVAVPAQEVDAASNPVGPPVSAQPVAGPELAPPPKKFHPADREQDGKISQENADRWFRKHQVRLRIGDYDTSTGDVPTA